MGCLREPVPQGVSLNEGITLLEMSSQDGASVWFATCEVRGGGAGPCVRRKTVVIAKLD